MHLTIIGAGYVGLVTGACLADFGHTVTCIDTDSAKVARLRQGEIPIFEPGLDTMVKRNLAQGRLRFDTDASASVPDADAVFIAVGTPPTEGGAGGADLSYVRGAIRGLAPFLSGYTVIITKSTVPVGLGDEIEAIIRTERPDAEVSVASNPEFLREGAAITDFKLPNRIVVGTNDERARAVLAEIYRPLFINEAPILFTDRRTAELIKYASNAYLATKITFINEMADLCEVVGADVQEVARGMGLDNRIGPKFLHAGPGYGGSCFPKDTTALVKTAEEHGVNLSIVSAVVAANRRRKESMAGRVVAALGGSAEGMTVAVLGLTFKPNTDDMRDAPSLDLVPRLQAAGARVRAFDPEGMAAAAALLPGLDMAGNPYECAAGADALVFVTEWEAFRALDLSRLRATMRQPLIVDLRNIYRPDEARAAGFVYRSIGRPALDSGAARG